MHFVSCEKVVRVEIFMNIKKFERVEDFRPSGCGSSRVLHAIFFTGRLAMPGNATLHTYCNAERLTRPPGYNSLERSS